VGELAPIGGLGAEFQNRGLTIDRLVVQRRDPEAARFEPRHFVVLKIDDLVGVLGEGGDVRGRQGFIRANAQDQGAAAPRHNDLLRVSLVQHGNAEGAANLKQRFVNGRLQVTLVSLGNQVDEHFGVGF